jgi:hypothetical protein
MVNVWIRDKYSGFVVQELVGDQSSSNMGKSVPGLAVTRVLEITHFGNEEEVKIAIYDMTGRNVLMAPVSTDPKGEGKATITFSLKSGFYIISTRSFSGVVARKLVVQ